MLPASQCEASKCSRPANRKPGNPPSQPMGSQEMLPANQWEAGKAPDSQQEALKMLPASQWEAWNGYRPANGKLGNSPGRPMGSLEMLPASQWEALEMLPASQWEAWKCSCPANGKPGNAPASQWEAWKWSRIKYWNFVIIAQVESESGRVSVLDSVARFRHRSA